MNRDDPQFWLNAHYIEKWDGVEARDWYVRNDIQIFHEDRLQLAPHLLSDYSVQNEETRLLEEAGDRSGGGTDDSGTPG